MTTHDEPNALPPVFCDWQEWRVAHAEFVKEFQASPRGASDELRLRIRLKRLGYAGARLDDEIKYIEQCTAS